MNSEVLTVAEESPPMRPLWSASPTLRDNDTREKLKWAVPLLREADAVRVLDVGSAGGRTANAAALRGFRVTALSTSDHAMALGRAGDITGAVRYVRGGAEHSPLDSASFDAILAFDIFLKAERPDLVIQEFSRLLRPNGILLFQACNRNALSWTLRHLLGGALLNEPDRAPGDFLHCIRPREFEKYCQLANFEVLSWEGLRLRMSRPLFQIISDPIADFDADSRRASPLRLFYCGVARKRW